MNAVMLQLLRRTWRSAVSDPLVSSPHDIDWTGFCSVVHRCQIAALLYERLSTRRGMVPPPVLEWLRLGHDQTRRKNLHLLAELETITSHLSKHGIPVLVLKGPVVGHLGVGMLVRTFHDLDLLVRREDVETAAAILASLGFKEVGGAEQEYHRIFIRVLNGMATVVEVHFDLTNPRHASTPDVAGVWARSVDCDLGGLAVRTPELTDHLLLVMDQLPSHYWAPAGLLDVAQIVDRWKSAISWPDLFARAKMWRMHALVRSTLDVVAALLPVDLPEVAVECIRPENYFRRVQWQMAQQAIREQLAAHPDYRVLRPAKFLIVDRFDDAVRLLRRRIVPSGPSRGSTRYFVNAVHGSVASLSSLMRLLPLFARASGTRRIEPV